MRPAAEKASRYSTVSGKKVYAFARRLSADGGAQNHRVPIADYAGSICLLGDAANLDGKVAVTHSD